MRTQLASSPSLGSTAQLVPRVPPVTTFWWPWGTKHRWESQLRLRTPGLTRSGVPGGRAVPGTPPRTPPGVPWQCWHFPELPWDVGPCSGGIPRAVHPGALLLPALCLILPCPRRCRSRRSLPGGDTASWELPAEQAGVAGSPPKHPRLALVTQHYHFIIL